MRHHITIIFSIVKALIALQFISLAAAQECSILLSLEEALSSIESTNPTILISRAKIDEANQSANIAKADLFPQVGLSFKQNRYRSVANFGTAAFPFHSTRYDADLEASYDILNLSNYASYKSNKLASEVTQFNYHNVLQETLAETARAFYLHFRNLKRLDVLNSNIQQSETLLNISEAQYQAGTASPLDVTRAEVQLANDQKQKLIHLNLLKQSELKLKTLLDLPIDCCLQLTPPAEYELSPHAYPCDFPEALATRSDYQAALKQLQQYQYNEDTAYWDYIPKLNLAGSAGYASMTPIDGDDDREWGLSATLSMPLFDGFRIRSNKLKSAAQARAQCSLIRDLENTIAADLALSQQTLQSRYEQLQLTQKQVGLGKRELELANAQFTNGTADNRDLVDAQANLAKFSDDYVLALYNYDLARIDWAQTMGNVCLLLPHDS